MSLSFAHYLGLYKSNDLSALASLERSVGRKLFASTTTAPVNPWLLVFFLLSVMVGEFSESKHNFWQLPIYKDLAAKLNRTEGRLENRIRTLEVSSRVGEAGR